MGLRGTTGAVCMEEMWGWKNRGKYRSGLRGVGRGAQEQGAVGQDCLCVVPAELCVCEPRARGARGLQFGNEGHRLS